MLTRAVAQKAIKLNCTGDLKCTSNFKHILCVTVMSYPQYHHYHNGVLMIACDKLWVPNSCSVVLLVGLVKLINSLYNLAFL